jgi:hypothetical protein
MPSAPTEDLNINIQYKDDDAVESMDINDPKIGVPH